MRFLLSSLLCFLFVTQACSQTTLQPAGFTISHLPLPEAMNKQVCISGIKYFDNKLFFASERCPVILVADPATGNIIRSINTKPQQNFEMEGLTSYKGKLYLISENTVAVYEVNMGNGVLLPVVTSLPLPPKSKSGDGMEGIAANEKNNKFYLLRERNENMSSSQILVFTVAEKAGNETVGLVYQSTIELPLENPQWRYSDICYDSANARLLCLKSFSKGKTRKQFIESVNIDSTGNLLATTLQNIPVENFSETSNKYKDQRYSMNLEGITVDEQGNIFLVSDNTSGQADCDRPSKEKTILFKLVKKGL
jgi:uncharacterized protein YjiK